MKSSSQVEDDGASRTYSKDSKRQRFKQQMQEIDDFDKVEPFGESDRQDSSSKKQFSVDKESDSRKLSKPSASRQSSKKVSIEKESKEKESKEKESKEKVTESTKVESKTESTKQKAEEKRDEGKGSKGEEIVEEEEPRHRDIDSETESVDFSQELNQFYSWLEKEPYLPKNIDDEVIITFLWESASVEEAEQKFQNYFYARQEMRSVFRDRHPCGPNNLFKYDAVCVVPLTNGLHKKWIIFATWLAHEDPQKFSIFHMMKLIFTELDILLQENQVRGKTVSVLIDMDGYTEEHTKMITRYAGKKLSHLFTDCFPATFNGFYIINAPPHVADYTALFGPFDFHIVEYMEDLPGFLPKQFLPSDMAGEPDAPPRNALFEPFFKRMRRCGNWLAYEEFLRSQELMLRMTTTREEFHAESDGKKKNGGGGDGEGHREKREATGKKGKGGGKGKKGKGGAKGKKKKK